MDGYKENGHGDLLLITMQQQDTIINVEQRDPNQEQQQKKKQTKVVGVIKVKAFCHHAYSWPATGRVNSDVLAPQVTGVPRLTRQCGLVAYAGLLQACEGTPMLHAAASSHCLLPAMLIEHCGSCIGS